VVGVWGSKVASSGEHPRRVLFAPRLFPPKDGVLEANVSSSPRSCGAALESPATGPELSESPAQQLSNAGGWTFLEAGTAERGQGEGAK
jgi:hypothetical protein